MRDNQGCILAPAATVQVTLGGSVASLSCTLWCGEKDRMGNSERGRGKGRRGWRKRGRGKGEGEGRKTALEVTLAGWGFGPVSSAPTPQLPPPPKGEFKALS